MSIWRNFMRTGAAHYELGRLVDARVRRETEATAVAHHVVCDIDKTYLETAFESVLRMARIAFERPSEKITVTGAGDLLQLLRWGELAGGVHADSRGRPLETESGTNAWPRPLHFVSSSPPQLRAVLEEKLMLDDLDWTSETFKNQAYNLRMGRMSLLRQHVGYKSLAIFRAVRRSGRGSCLILLGDNAESDAFIYLGVKFVCEGVMDASTYTRFLQISGVDEKTSQDVCRELPEPGHASVDTILIRNVPGYEFNRISPLTDAVQTFDNFFEASLVLALRGLIAPQTIWPLTRRFHNRHGFSHWYLNDVLQALAAKLGGPVHDVTGGSRSQRSETAQSALLAALTDSIERLAPSMAHTPRERRDATLTSGPDDFAARAVGAAGASSARALAPAEELIAGAQRWFERLNAEREG